MGGPTAPLTRRVMIVADPSRESSGALEWALSHAVLDHDEIILLHVEPNSSRRHHSFATFLKRPAPMPAGTIVDERGDRDFMDEMRRTCKVALPRVQVRIERVEMEMERKDKGSVILLKAKVFSADMIVVGQRRTLSQTFFGSKFSSSMGNSGSSETAEYLIENSKCLCVGVQKKGQNAGYLLNTKTRRNFWLLA